MEGTLEECREYVKNQRSQEPRNFIGYIIYKRIEKDKGKGISHKYSSSFSIKGKPASKFNLINTIINTIEGK